MKAFYAVFLEFREGKIHQLAELRLFRGLVANETEKGGSSRVLARGYCYLTHFCGTVPPLSWKKLAASIWVCGQGSCYSPLVCCSVALAPCWHDTLGVNPSIEIGRKRRELINQI